MARQTNEKGVYTFRVIDTDYVFLKEPKVFKEDREMRDQFGRRWMVTVETKSQAPTGLAVACFPQVLGIPQKYLLFDKKRPYDIFIHFEGWIADLKQDRIEWERHLDDICEKLYGEKAHTDAPTRKALDIAGEPPLPHLLVALYQAGDKYLLGQRDAPTKAVEKAAAAWLEAVRAHEHGVRVREAAQVGGAPIRTTDHHLTDELKSLMAEDDGPVVSGLFDTEVPPVNTAPAKPPVPRKAPPKPQMAAVTED
jgi:hypothetical protein